MNELYWIGMLALNFVMILIAFRLWGKLGLYIWIPISVIVANIQVTKNVMPVSYTHLTLPTNREV